MSQILVEVAEEGSDTSLLRCPAGFWTAIDKAKFAEGVVQTIIMSRSPVPAWLQKALNQDHISNVWQILFDRERSRIRVRLLLSAASRLQHDIPPAPQHAGANADHYSAALGRSPDNHFCNRYPDIVPYDRTRVDVGGRYFNANWSHRGHPHPTRPPGEPALRFARVRTVVQLTPNVESGTQRQKAHPYFPHKRGESWVVRPAQEASGLPPFKVTLVETETIESAHCVASTVSVAPIVAGVARPAVTFRHMLYGAWPDHGIPEDRVGLLNFIRLVDHTNRDLHGLEATADAEPPTMIHCSAGVGRTGAFIAIDSLLRANGLLLSPHTSQSAERASLRPTPLPQSPLGPLPERVSWDEVAQEIDSLREQRPGMVERPEQALLVYEALLVAAYG
ncbi:protein-tyrosine phosphatase-like protein [Russula brevipes]|nr:protein-tyrosine phosphatase-like protein [Russula brevipes]